MHTELICLALNQPHGLHRYPTHLLSRCKADFWVISLGWSNLVPPSPPSGENGVSMGIQEIHPEIMAMTIVNIWENDV